MTFLDERLPPRFWAMVAPCPMSGCWLWTGCADRDGYGWHFSAARKIVRAHTVAYRALVGEVPPGLELDHRCRVRCCCNPAHLEAVTHAENCARTAGYPRRFRPRVKRAFDERGQGAWSW